MKKRKRGGLLTPEGKLMLASAATIILWVVALVQMCKVVAAS